ncbi:hypothetical protein ADK38_17280, partial [Streptomyces varsoviensis]
MAIHHVTAPVAGAAARTRPPEPFKERAARPPEPGPVRSGRPPEPFGNRAARPAGSRAALLVLA